MPTETYKLREQVFTWDRDKNISNLEKHGILFKNAAIVFFDPFATTYNDEKHSQDEDRFLIVGLDKKHKLLTVCHCFRDDDKVIRIISARKASKEEAKIYGGAF